VPAGNSITALPAHERPRERLVRLGAAALSDAELVAIQLGAGRPGESVLALAQCLLIEYDGVAGLAHAAVDELARRPGIGIAKASRLVAAFALTDRVAGPPTGSFLRSSADIAVVAAALIGRERTEHVVVIIADHQQRVRRVERVAQGGAAGSLVPVREVLSLVLRHDGMAFALAHNHPAGVIQPSQSDFAVTDRLRAGAEQLGLRFLDHVIVSGDRWCSVNASR
jgi:DNA repair protein RadC